MRMFSVMICSICGAPGNEPYTPKGKCSRCGGETHLKDIIYGMNEIERIFFFETLALLGDDFFLVIKNCNEHGCLFRYKTTHVYGKLWWLKPGVGEKKFFEEFPDVYLSMKEGRVIDWGTTHEILKLYYTGKTKLTSTVGSLNWEETIEIKNFARLYKKFVFDLTFPDTTEELKIATFFFENPIDEEDISYVLQNKRLNRDKCSDIISILEKATVSRQYTPQRDVVKS